MKTKVISFPPSPQFTLDHQLRFAIANKRLIRFTYDGAVRVAEPHDYGVRDGAAKLLAFQREKAGSKAPDVRGWRWLETSKIQDCVVLEDSFRGTREAAQQHHQVWDILYARVDHTT
jgi:hypothetical protein